MKVLLIGGGGREHALAWKLAQSPRVTKLFCAPGNAGMANVAECVPIAAVDLEGLLQFAKKEKISLTVVGPEAVLALGIVDRFKKEGLAIFGPTREAAKLESSKAYTKEFCRRYNIPQAAFAVFANPQEAKHYVKKMGRGFVVKADGLAQGKGVVVCRHETETLQAIDTLSGGGKIVLEEFLEGEEASFIAITDGNHILPLASSQDHKRLRDGDEGPNTGGMGAYSPAPVVDAKVFDKVMTHMMLPAVHGMVVEGHPFVGVLYAGLMIHKGEPKLLEFNVRFGDPECQPLMMRLQSDLVGVIQAALKGTLHQVDLVWDRRPAVCVVMASGGYPEKYEKGKVIEGLPKTPDADCVVFHAGTRCEGKKIVTDGGRVLGITAMGETVEAARNLAYQRVETIRWEGAYYRKDIGWRALSLRGA